MALSETLRGTRASALGFSFAARFAAAATSSGSFPRSSANALSWKRVPILVLVLLVWLAGWLAVSRNLEQLQRTVAGRGALPADDTADLGKGERNEPVSHEVNEPLRSPRSRASLVNIVFFEVFRHWRPSGGVGARS